MPYGVIFYCIVISCGIELTKKTKGTPLESIVNFLLVIVPVVLLCIGGAHAHTAWENRNKAQ